MIERNFFILFFDCPIGRAVSVVFGFGRVKHCQIQKRAVERLVGPLWGFLLLGLVLAPYFFAGAWAIQEGSTIIDDIRQIHSRFPRRSGGQLSTGLLKAF